MMASGAQVLDDQSQVLVGALSWHRIETKYSSQDGSQSFVAGFHTEHNGHDYFGYARSTTREAARAMADRFLRGLMVRPIDARPERSLTGVGFYGKKYYFGFGDYLS